MASAAAARRELLKAAMHKGRLEPAKKKSSRVSANGDHGHNGAAVFDFTKDELEAAIQRYVELYDFAPIAHVSLDRSGRIEEANFAAARLLGRDRDSLAGTPFSLYVAKPDADIFLHHLLQCRSSEDRAEVELRLRSRAGKTIPVQLSTVPSDPSGHDGALVLQTAIIDLTERKQGERLLAEAAHQQSALYDFVQRRHEARSVDDIYAAGLEALFSTLTCDRASILLFDEAGVMRFVSWRGLSARYRRAVEGHSPWKRGVKNARPVALNDGDLADFPKSLKAAMRREGIRAVAFIPLITGGKLIGKVVTYYNAPHDFGTNELGVAFHIASQLGLGIERKQAEEALNESEEFHRALVQQATVAMARTDLKGRLEFVNANFCKMLGYKEAELLGKTVLQITHPADAAENRKLFDRLVREGRPYQHEKRYIRKDGSVLWANVSAAPMRDATGKTRSAIAVIVDISERKRAQAAVDDAKSVLEKRVIERTTELTAVIGELESQIALRRRLEGEILSISDREQRRLGQDLHDSLCQHLTAVAFMTQAVARRLKDHRVVEVSDIEKIADLINNGVTEARTIARGLHPVEMDPAGLESALRGLLRHQSRLPYRLDIDQDIEISDPNVSLHLFRIAREAVVNANKHAKGREIVVRLRNLPRFIELSVTDDGIGPPRKFVEGPGMGFHIMEYRARSIGALLEVVAAKPRGTRVACYLPRK